ncbi:MAG: GAF domain-containing protein [Anaerolineales bacterium]|jgi:GAF domain-containing protein|uniref:GAF domain-containing protein n=1 Tax=Candidatus Villigracilis affinis TaxID=3140682 RepID=UPI001B6F190B|nr:GAF domain-containing protein [Anaerolineales bacterium]MBK9601922.1 GAF domain-containing protein [Anaerolineales bacterium]MBP8047615.1 GAF domain-containing protein [Anaerolineales bacterium]
MMESNSTNPEYSPEEATRQLYKTWREQFTMPLLIGSLVLGVLALIPALSGAGNTIIKVLFVSVYVLTGIVTVIRFPYSIRMGVFLLSIFALALGELFTHGILGDSLFFFLGLIVFATLMLSPRAGIAAIVLDILTFVVIGLLMQNGQLIPINPNASPAKPSDWISAGAAITMFGVIIILGFQRLEAAIFETQKQIQSTLSVLKHERDNLENSVTERTQLLQKVNRVGRSITAILDPNELLNHAVFLISDELECYYTAIFIIDATNQWAELRAATGDAGRVLIENKHHLNINGKSAVGTAIRVKQVRFTLDGGTDSVRSDNPLLPYTRSQIALPLAIGDRVIGALELHSTKENAFLQQDADAYQNMANQISIAIENSRLFTESQQSLAEMSATQQQYLKGAWLSLAADQKLEYAVGDSETIEKQEIEIPLTLRDQIIGQINMSSANDWTPEQKNLIESVAIQAALALENARLVEESQSIATRERLVNEITSKVWASTTIDSILQTTVRELGRALEAAEVNIEVSMSDNNE